MCASPVSMFGISVILHGLLGTTSNLELRKREGMAGWTFNNAGLVGLMGDIDTGLRVMRPAMMLSVHAIFGEVSEET